MQQVVAGVVRTALLPPVVGKQALDALLQQREIQFQRFDPASFRSQVQPSDADLQTYYAANAAESGQDRDEPEDEQLDGWDPRDRDLGRPLHSLDFLHSLALASGRRGARRSSPVGRVLLAPLLLVLLVVLVVLALAIFVAGGRAGVGGLRGG